MNLVWLGRTFVWSAGAILLGTAGLKVVNLLQAVPTHGVNGGRQFLDLPAPYISEFTNAGMMWLGIGFELVVIVALLSLRTERLRLALVAGVGGVFAAYHLGLGLIDYRQPCGCLGGPMDWLKLTPGAYQALTVGIIGYLLAGSYGLLLWERLRSQRGQCFQRNRADGASRARAGMSE